jgi:hypothetical protein
MMAIMIYGHGSDDVGNLVLSPSFPMSRRSGGSIDFSFKRGISKPTPSPASGQTPSFCHSRCSPSSKPAKSPCSTRAGRFGGALRQEMVRGCRTSRVPAGHSARQRTWVRLAPTTERVLRPVYRPESSRSRRLKSWMGRYRAT